LRFIAHRGNVAGPSNLENSPTQIDACLNESFDCEIDLWVQNGEFMLGHDFGEYVITKEWILQRQEGLWIHCKNSEALNSLRSLNSPILNYFWHQEDSYSLTSQNFIWVYPGIFVPPGGISVLPEKWIREERGKEICHGFGICSDYIMQFKEQFGE
jgi:hypothetical protein